ncbi:MAG: type II toxin-antitoxin system VapC family toxin [Chloroflexi bacterium]|nr:type II toxin-antitoxin system VapC family toxin [Chloroflexota bacterium]
MDSYFDSAIIIKLYVQEATSPEAIRLAGGYAAPYALTQWQALEVKNAIRLKSFRGEIAAAEMHQSIAAFEQDIATGRWQRPSYTAAGVEQKAEELSAGHSAILGCRTLDIIHVAAALVIGAKDFVTFDGRQGALARQAGLTVKP